MPTVLLTDRPPATDHNAQCQHATPCPPATATDHRAARTIASHAEQGWSLLCNGVVVFDDGGELQPDNSATGAHRGPAEHSPGHR